jgi:hypothetical protein
VILEEQNMTAREQIVQQALRQIENSVDSSPRAEWYASREMADSTAVLKRVELFRDF